MIQRVCCGCGQESSGRYRRFSGAVCCWKLPSNHFFTMVTAVEWMLFEHFLCFSWSSSFIISFLHQQVEHCTVERGSVCQWITEGESCFMQALGSIPFTGQTLNKATKIGFSFCLLCIVVPLGLLMHIWSCIKFSFFSSNVSDCLERMSQNDLFLYIKSYVKTWPIAGHMMQSNVELWGLTNFVCVLLFICPMLYMFSSQWDLVDCGVGM